MRLGRPLLLAALAVGAAFAACTLNPQPLPPSDDDRAQAAPDGSFGSSDSGAITTDPETPPPGPLDATPAGNDGEGGIDGSMDGGDGGITDADTDAG